jgi:hypothetical protein
VIRFADTEARRRERIATAIRALQERIGGTERLSDELYAEIADRFDVPARGLQREWVRIHWGGS